MLIIGLGGPPTTIYPALIDAKLTSVINAGADLTIKTQPTTA